jgi:mono/diheme cytochrome c family protein
MKRSAVVGLIIGAFAAMAILAAFRTPTYRRDIQPILEKNCVACHSPGRVAPMSFATYEDARPWARQMKAVVTKRKMPPGIVEKHYGLFGDDGSLNQMEIDAIVQWADAGAPEGAVQETATVGR